MRFNYNKILLGKKPYIIAEIGVNHECSIIKAKKLIYLAKKGGADAAKFQTYKADKIAMINSKAYWDTSKEKIKTQHKLFSKFDKFDDNDYKFLSNYCKKLKIDFLSTPFDLESVSALKSLVPVFKVSSSDITNYPLLNKIAQTKKPVILSTGASNISEIKAALNILKKGTKKIVIMHCILNYPTKDSDANLNMIIYLKKIFKNFIIGYSDHTLAEKSMLNLTTAYLLGAKVIEKHFTLNKKLKGNDHYHSMDVHNLKYFKKNINKINLILGSKNKKSVLKSELKSRKFARRCIVLKNKIKKNSIITEKDIVALRPNVGISTIYWKKIIGKKITKDLKANTALRWKDLKK
jgi:sialic acid synthase SpsE